MQNISVLSAIAIIYSHGNNGHLMYRDLIKRKFPQDERAGLFVVPQLPAVKLGRILRKDRRIASPNDVMALHINDGMFSSETLIFTDTHMFHDSGSFPLAELKETQMKGNNLTIFANQKGELIPHKVSVKNEQVARILKSLLDDIRYYNPEAEALLEKTRNYETEGFSGSELDWLRLRDEVMRTIDMLYERYNDGKLSVLEYEEKKEELLSRL